MKKTDRRISETDMRRFCEELIRGELGVTRHKDNPCMFTVRWSEGRLKLCHVTFVVTEVEHTDPTAPIVECSWCGSSGELRQFLMVARDDDRLTETAYLCADCWSPK